MKIAKLLMLVSAMTVGSASAEEWQKMAFIGNAHVKTVSGLVEVISGNEARMLHEKEMAQAGQTLRIWRGAEVVLQMKSSGSLVRAKGPVLLRLAPDSEGYERASLTGREETDGFVVRAVWGHGKYLIGERWQDLRPGMTLPEGAKVRPFRDSALDFYHPATRTALRITDHKKPTQLTPRKSTEVDVSMLASTTR